MNEDPHIIILHFEKIDRLVWNLNTIMDPLAVSGTGQH